MNRRDFVKSIAIVAPIVSGCVAPPVYNKAKHGAIRRIGIVAYPQAFEARISRDLNQYSQAGENDAIARRLRNAMRGKFDRFEIEMRRELAATLSAGGVSSSEVPHDLPSPFIDPTRGTPDYSAAGEPFYLECQITLTFMRLKDGIAPGAGTFNRLFKAEGISLWSNRISIGPSIFVRSRFIGMPTRRYKDVQEIVTFADEASAILMSFAAPMGRAIGESLLSEQG
jgi:hypothetical protein